MMTFARTTLGPDKVVAEFWEKTKNDRLRCVLCPRECTLKEGQRGFCLVRKAHQGQMVFETYGKAVSLCVDPIEKKPLFHFVPNSPVLSMGGVGCNLGCVFCQNHSLSRAPSVDFASKTITPEALANAAVENACRSVAFTYNEPITFLEYAVDAAKACHDQGIYTVLVTNGYVQGKARKALFSHMDAANVDLKAFSKIFYQKLCKAHLQPVLDTLTYIKKETQTWLEITNLLIPGENDNPDEIRAMCDFVANTLGPDVPMHFSAFHPDHQLVGKPRTDPKTLSMAKEVAHEQGIQYVYTGNVTDPKGQSTYCHACGSLLIERDWYAIGKNHIEHGKCPKCSATIPGKFG